MLDLNEKYFPFLTVSECPHSGWDKLELAIEMLKWSRQVLNNAIESHNESEIRLRLSHCDTWNGIIDTALFGDDPISIF